MNTSIPELKIERIEDEHGALILLEQDCGGNIDRVAIHPIHLRYMAEQFGLIATSDPQAVRTIARLERRLRVIRDRVDHLGDWLTNHSDREHADLEYEIAHVTATMDLLDAFCEELEGGDDVTPRHATSQRSASNADTTQIPCNAKERQGTPATSLEPEDAA